jgi:hypothetical protein
MTLTSGAAAAAAEGEAQARARRQQGGLHLPQSEEGVRLAQKTQVGPYIPVGIQLLKDEVGPTSGPAGRPSPSPGRTATAAAWAA